VDAAKPAVQAEAEKEPVNAAPSNEADPVALPGPRGVTGTTPADPTKPTGGKPQLRRIK
jgi:hypothetical protein